MASLEEDIDIEENRHTYATTVHNQNGTHGLICNEPISGVVNSTHNIGLVNSSSGSHNQSRTITAQGDVHMPAVHVHLNMPTPATRLRSVEVRSSFVQQVIKSVRAFFRGLANRYTPHDPMAGEATPESSVDSVSAYHTININLSPETDPDLEDAKGEVDMTESSDDSDMEIDEYNVSSISDFDLRSVKFRATTYAAVYTLRMLDSCAEGLPCWRPTPYPPTGQRGVIPGDVGTFDLIRGFKKIFNLWENDCAESSLLPGETTTQSDYFPEGHIIPSGISSRTHHSEDTRTIIDFTCKTEQGALLACTRSADFEEMADMGALKDFLLKNAGEVYRHASNINSLVKKGESLYIITGCIKSDGWGLAAFRDATPGDLLRLSEQHLGNHRTAQGKIYDWSVRGPAEARVWPNPEKEAAFHDKNQSLFLQGFKLAFSASFRARMDTSLRSPPLEGDSFDGDQRHGEPNDTSGSPSDDSGSSGATGAGSDSSNSSSNTDNAGDPALFNDIQVYSFPSAAIFHPCDMINKQLLQMTGADCALSHDKDWMFIKALWNRMDAFSLDIIASSKLSVRRGSISVAHMLTRRPSSETGGTVTIGRPYFELNNLQSQLFGDYCTLSCTVKELPTVDFNRHFIAIVALVKNDGLVNLGAGEGHTREEARDCAARAALQYLQTQFPEETGRFRRPVTMANADEARSRLTVAEKVDSISPNTQALVYHRELGPGA